MTLGPMQIAVIVLLILVLFGRGKVSELMGDFGKGIKSFKKGLADDADSSAPQQISQASPPASEAKSAPAETTSANSGN